MKRAKLYAGIVIVIILFFLIFFSSVWADTDATPFAIGEKIRYSIYAAGWRVGYQTIELDSIQKVNEVDVYLLKGLSRTAVFVSIFYRLNDEWSVFIDKSTLLPLRVEKDWQEGKGEGFYIYEIDQQNRIVTLNNVSKGNTKTMNPENDVFDLFSLIYFYRKNSQQFNSSYTFDFLEPKSVRTVHFQNEGEEEIEIPKITRQKDVTIKAQKLKQIGGIGIEIYVATDDLRLPLKMVVPSKLPKGKKLDIEFYIDKFTPSPEQKNIPRIYNLLKY
jgi:hypothetical protein